MMRKLTKQKIFRHLEEKLKTSIKEKLWNKEFLYDGLNDKTIRPNAFIAYYIYPNLLARKEWIKCFDAILNALWLGWGGVSTIDKKNHLFHKEHTGEDSKSYHNGDSWFWLNNLTALLKSLIVALFKAFNFVGRLMVTVAIFSSIEIKRFS